MPKQTTLIDEEFIDAAPLKSFFVQMLTRDIDLEDAILDLLDNCIDGILRLKKDLDEKKKKDFDDKKPYHGFFATIRIEPNYFSIFDNCGGIPWDLNEYAFRMGRSTERAETLGSVGYYGIGMKRAIFKMGRESEIKTSNKEHHYKVNITADWLRDETSENAWKLPIENIEWSGKDGTIIEIRDLYDGIAKQFNENSVKFISNLERIISTQYAVILEKGFEVVINGNSVKPRALTLSFDSQTTGAYKVEPYVYRAESSDGVKVFLTVGFTRPIPSENELDEEKGGTKYSSVDAGWTIICNDRVVVYCNRDELTGWGEAGVPRFHNQFIAISGIVEFWSQDPGKLPTTTTKRGLDAASPIFLQVKNKMREGLKIFTNYTYKWKGLEQESKQQINKGSRLSLNEIKEKATKLKMHTTPRSILSGSQYIPKLPMPKVAESTMKRITFFKDIKVIREVATYFGNPDLEPNDVGERCFDIIHKDAKKR